MKPSMKFENLISLPGHERIYDIQTAVADNRKQETTSNLLRRLPSLFARVLALALLSLLAPAAFAGPPENTPVWRAQLRVRVADVSDAGTDDGVKVELNSRNVTWLDYARDDFKRNDEFTYDLALADVKNPGSPPSVSRLSDITRLTIEKTGDDGLCLKEIDLRIDGRSIYREVFEGAGLWLDSDQGRSRRYSVASAQLRQNSHWQIYPPLSFPRDLPRVFSRNELESRIESLIGTFIHGNRLYWGHLHGRGVEVTKRDDQTLHVDLDLAVEVPGFNPEVDIDFDLVIACGGGKISAVTRNMKVDVDSSWYAEVLSLSGYDALDHILRGIIRSSLEPVSFVQDTGQPLCPLITVGANGDVSLLVPAQPVVRKVVKVTFLSVKVADGISPLGSENLVFDFNVNGQVRRNPAVGTQAFQLGQPVMLPAALSFSQEMTSGNLRLYARTALTPVVRDLSRSRQMSPSPIRWIEVRREYDGANNFGRGTHTERSTDASGYFEITYRIEVQNP